MAEYPSHPSDVLTVYEHAQRLTVPAEPPSDHEGSPVLMVPRDYKILPVPGWEPRIPSRVKAVVHLDSCNSFIDYVMTWKRPETVIFSNEGDDLEGELEPVIEACIDYHSPESPAYCTHRVRFEPQRTPAWLAWRKSDKQQMSQGNFALFLEDHALEITEPNGADLLGIVNALEIDGELSFQKIQRLQDGTVKFKFSNATTAKAGELSLPYMFKLTLPLYESQPATLIQARLRYRLVSEKVALWFELLRAREAERDQLELFSDRIGLGTKIIPYKGTFGTS